MSALAVEIAVKRKRNFKFVEIPYGESTIHIREINGYQPIEVAQAPKWTGKSSKYIRSLIEDGKLSAININGTPYTKQKRGGGNRLCFCLKEWENLIL